MRTAIIVCAAVGVITVSATLAIGHAKTERATEEYGRRLMMTMAPHRLACASCHIDGSAEAGELTLIDAISHYPGDKIKQRINKCVTSNMNAQALPEDSVEMAAIIARLRFVAGENATGKRETTRPFRVLVDDRPEPEAGAPDFAKRCADCHGQDGAGLPASRDPNRGYLFPPLWGPESFPDASEMSDVRTLSLFIRVKMPLGHADLDERQAWSLARFILSKPRPHLR